MSGIRAGSVNCSQGSSINLRDPLPGDASYATLLSLRMLQFDAVRPRTYNQGFSVVAVAQLVESRIVIPAVVGSNPIGHPNTSRAHLARPPHAAGT